jgi:hypothetical protein
MAYSNLYLRLSDSSRAAASQVKGLSGFGESSHLQWVLTRRQMRQRRAL